MPPLQSRQLVVLQPLLTVVCRLSWPKAIDHMAVAVVTVARAREKAPVVAPVVTLGHSKGLHKLLPLPLPQL